jgi:hypothetical protein
MSLLDYTEDLPSENWQGSQPENEGKDDFVMG